MPLLTGTRYPHQGYRLGETAWAVQFHPEATPEIFTDWAQEGGLDPAVAAGVREAEEKLVSAWRPLAEGFAGVVRTTAR